MIDPLITTAEIAVVLATRQRRAALDEAIASHDPYSGNPHARRGIDGVRMERHYASCPLPGCSWCRPPCAGAA